MKGMRSRADYQTGQMKAGVLLSGSEGTWQRSEKVYVNIKERKHENKTGCRHDYKNGKRRKKK